MAPTSEWFYVGMWMPAVSLSMMMDGARGNGFPMFVFTAVACSAFPFPCAPSTLCSPNWSTPSRAREQGEHPGHIPSHLCCWGRCFGSFGCLTWQGRSRAPGTHVPLSAAPIPQLLSLHLTQLNIKASKHFSSSAQHCLPNYPPAGLSDSASCFPGCWQPLASMPALLQGKPCSPDLPSHLSLQLPCLGVTSAIPRQYWPA